MLRDFEPAMLSFGLNLTLFTSKMESSIARQTEDQYFHVCPPGPVDHACGMPSSVSF